MIKIMESKWLHLSLLSMLLCGVCELKLPTSRPVQKQPDKGGVHGTPFDDVTAATAHHCTLVNVKSITVTYGERLSSIQVTYLLPNGSLYSAARHGVNSTGDKSQVISISEGYVSRIEGSTDGKVVGHLNISVTYAKDTHVYGPFGKYANGNTNFTMEGHVVGFHGRAEKFLDSVGVYSLPIAKVSPLWGKDDERFSFSVHPDLTFPAPVVRLSKLFVLHLEGIWGILKALSGIQMELQLLGGGTRLTPMYGAASGNLTIITFDSDESLTGVKGQFQSQPGSWIEYLTFETSLVDGRSKSYGPFGLYDPIDTNFSFCGSGIVLGLAGRYYDDDWDAGVGAIQLYYCNMTT